MSAPTTVLYRAYDEAGTLLYVGIRHVPDQGPRLMRADELDVDTALHGGEPRLGSGPHDLAVIVGIAVTSIAVAYLVFRAVAHAVVWAGADPATRGPIVVGAIVGLALVLAVAWTAQNAVAALRARRRRRSAP